MFALQMDCRYSLVGGFPCQRSVLAVGSGAACVVGWGAQGLRKVTAEKNQELLAAETVGQPRVMASALHLPLLSLLVGA